jgi:RepB plasmid partitioning protein
MNVTEPKSGPCFKGVAPEAHGLLQSKKLGAKAWEELARMVPMRQVEAARLMVASGCYSAPYLRSIVAASDASLIGCLKARPRIPLESRKRKAASEEITALADQLTKLTTLNGLDLITLLVSCRYAERLLSNPRTKRYLQKQWPEILTDLESIVREARN